MQKINNPCKQVRSRQGMWASFKERIRDRLSDHIATCPRCQKRLAMVNRVELAIGLLKSQPHGLDLLSRANTKAIGVLKHSLRDAPRSEKLRHSRPDQHWLEKKRPVIERVLNIAACLFVVVMIRMGVTSSLTDVKNKGETALHNYYARNLDNQLYNEIFPEDARNA